MNNSVTFDSKVIGRCELVVATRVAEIDFAVLDDRVVPVGNVDRSVRSQLHVDSPERDVVGFDPLDLVARGEADSVPKNEQKSSLVSDVSNAN